MDAQGKPLFDDEAYLEQMSYYYSIFVSAGSVHEAAKQLNISESEMWEAIELNKPKGTHNG